jgi:hypothetical protein
LCRRLVAANVILTSDGRPTYTYLPFSTFQKQNNHSQTPATQSLTYDGDEVRYGANLAVDGNVSTTSYADNGEHLHNGPAWWQVDLLVRCVVYDLIITAPMLSERHLYFDVFE